MKKNVLSTAAMLMLAACTTVSAQLRNDFPEQAAPVRAASSSVNPALSKGSLHPDLIQLQRSLAKDTRALSTNANAGNGNLDLLQVSNGNVLVDISVLNGDIHTALQALSKTGFVLRASIGRLISGTIPIASLNQLATISQIRFVKPAYKPMHKSHAEPSPFGATSGVKITSVQSQGDTAQRTSIARSKYGVNGKGVKVGILSVSYDILGTAAKGVAAGELPGPANPFGYKTPVKVLSEYTLGDGTDEGRAMAEIVHDVAPAASIYFYSAFNGELDFANGILQLADSGCKVIVDDVTYFDEPFFQDGILAQAVDSVKAKGVSYISAAGNSGNLSYESEYRGSSFLPFDAQSGTAHNFSAPGTTPRYFQPIFIPKGRDFYTALQWDQPSFSAGAFSGTDTGAVTDLDVYLLDRNLKGVSSSASDNIKSGDPTELISFKNRTTDSLFYLVIVKYDGPDPHLLKYVLFGDGNFYNTKNPIPGQGGSTVVGHANADGAIAVGASYYFHTPAYGVNPPTVNYYSSRGGTRILFDKKGLPINEILRKKPELVSADGGNTSFFDPTGHEDIKNDTDTFPNFFGTSASAPHVAGLAALMIDARRGRSLTPDQVKGILSVNTIDMDDSSTSAFDAGFDYASGYGFVKGDAAVGAVKPGSKFVKPILINQLCSDEPWRVRNWKLTNPNPFDVTTSWRLVSTTGEDVSNSNFVIHPGDTVIQLKNIELSAPFAGSRANEMLLFYVDADGKRASTYGFNLWKWCGHENLPVPAADHSLEIGNATSEAIVNTSQPTLNPNPAAGNVTVILPAISETATLIEVFSISNTRLATARIEAGNSSVTINVSGYAPGIYLVKVSQGEKITTLKLLKQ